MIEKINIGIAEDHVLVRQGFIRMLEDYKRINILFEVGNGRDLLTAIQDFKPSIILLDIAMPHMGGIKALELIRERYPWVKVIVISAYTEEVSIMEYVKLGAISFLDKACTVDTLITAIETVYNTGTYFDVELTKLLVKYGIYPITGGKKRELTERETIVLKLMCEDIPYTDIAQKIGIKVNTVEWYEMQLKKKTRCKNLKELQAYAASNNLLN